jgi:hypothetical protein
MVRLPFALTLGASCAKGLSGGLSSHACIALTLLCIIQEAGPAGVNAEPKFCFATAGNGQLFHMGVEVPRVCAAPNCGQVSTTTGEQGITFTAAGKRSFRQPA